MVHTFSEIEALISKVICPVCYHTDLEAVLRCDLGWSACLPTLHCNHCGYSFDREGYQTAVAAFERRITEGRVDLRCPSCGQADPLVEFRCDLNSHLCSYVVRCRGCGEVHYVSV